IAKIAQLVVKLKEAGDALGQAANTLPAVDKARIQQLAEQFAMRTLEYVVIGRLDEAMPTLTNALVLLGVMDMEYKPSNKIETFLPPTLPTPRRFYIDRLPKLFTDPENYFIDTFKWGAPDFDGSLLLQKVQRLLHSMGVPAEMYFPAGQPPVLEAYILSVSMDDSTSPPGLKFEVSLPGSTDFSQTIDFSDLWKGTVSVKAAYQAGLEAVLRPPLELDVS